MKKLSFKQWYAIIVLAVLIIYGGLYLVENRYKQMGDYMLDTWTWTLYQDLNPFFDD